MPRKILVLIDNVEGAVRPVSLEALGLARKLAGEGDVTALLAGSGLDAETRRLSASPADAIVVLDDPALSPFDPAIWCSALEQVTRVLKPDLVLMGQTYRNMDLAPQLSARLRTALVTGCIGIRGEGEDLRFVRSMFRGKLSADILVNSPKPWLIMVQPGAFEARAAEAPAVAVRHLDVETDPTLRSREVLGTIREAREKVDLSRAEVIVGVGRGLGKEENLQLVRELAEVLHAEIGASRPVVDSNWLERDRQIGSSGQTVSPKLYISLGISGAIQHVVGVMNSGCIVAVNRDPNAPIFNLATYGIVGDLEEIVPLLTDRLRQPEN